LTDLGRVITDSAAAVVGAMAAVPIIEAPAADRARSNEARASASTRDDEPFVDVRERVIGGSMPAGPDPVIDLVERGAAWDPAPPQTAEPTPAVRLTAKDAAVEVRGRIGDRWVEGFEICEVMSTPAGPRYRLRRRTDGVVLPELFEASSIRHVDTVEAHASEHAPVSGNQDAELHDRAPDTNDTSNDLNAPPHYWTRS
ncbi:MAG: hypothetical protein QOG65_92, partial [Actinomycetota bacterium]|nr:hypothetical protein [Actinomycetota bacterium]